MSPEQRDELVRELMCVEGKFYNGDEFYDCAEDHEGDTIAYDGMVRVVRRVEERYELADRDELAALEAENAALRGFVAGDDRIQQLWGEHGIKMSHCPDDMWAALNEQQDRRIALAAEHGLPLPGAGEPS